MIQRLRSGRAAADSDLAQCDIGWVRIGDLHAGSLPQPLL